MEGSLSLPVGQQLRAQLSQLIAAESPRLLRLAARLMGNPFDAEDVVQEGLLRAHRSLDAYRFEGNLGAWLSRIVVNEALHRLRRRRLMRRVAEFVGRKPERHPFGWQDENLDPEQVAQAAETMERLQRVLDSLPARQRVMVTLRYFEQLSIEEIASLTGVGSGTVKTHLVRALKKMRRMMCRPAQGDAP